MSSLVTLFGNILQNPLDPRAKSDTKLMNLVVNFLSMLGQEAETGGVHRMLGVCSEFERVARKVIEKAEKEQSTRRKRKGPDSGKPAPPSTATPSTQTHTPRPTATPKAPSQPTPPSTADAGLSPRTVKSNAGSEPSPALQSAGWPQEFSIPDDLSFSEMSGLMPTDMQSPSSMAGVSFQQPLLPQDLYSMPVSLDWEWAEMSGAAYPTVENGNFGDGGVPGMMGGSSGSG